MSAVPVPTLNDALAELLGEVFAGPQRPYTWIVSHDSTAGVLGTLAQISAIDASRSLAEGARSIAAHAEHVRFSLAYANAHLRGENPSPDFSRSWSVHRVTDAQWKQLQSSIAREFDEAHQAISSRRESPDPMMLTGSIAMIAHAAYHLGAIRQLARLLRQPPDLPTAAD